MVAPINLRDYSRTAASKGWGAGWPSCSGARNDLAIVTADRSGVRVSVRKRIARLVDLLMDETERRGYLLRKGQTGAYNCRAIGGTKTASNHSWGLAVDINWQINPMKRPLTTDMPGWMIALWNRYGFAWGGHYSGTPDAMHYEFMGTPEQADAMTALALREIGHGATPGIGTPVPVLTRRDEDVISPAVMQRDANGSFRGTAKAEAGKGSIYDAAWGSLVSTWGGTRVAIYAQDGAGNVIGRFPAQGYQSVPNNREFIPPLPLGTRFITFEGQADAGAIVVASGVCRAAA